MLHFISMKKNISKFENSRPISFWYHFFQSKVEKFSILNQKFWSATPEKVPYTIDNVKPSTWGILWIVFSNKKPKFLAHH